MRTTLLDFFNDFADSSAEFVINDDGYRFWTYQYRQIAGAARAFAARLGREGIGKGERVLFWSENRPEWLAAFWGCLLSGVIVVPIDYRSSAEVLRNVQNVVSARAILVGDEVRSDGLAEAAPVWRLANLDLSRSADPGPALAITAADIAEIVFTSGSTAAPKGVVITHRNVLADLDPDRARGAQVPPLCQARSFRSGFSTCFRSATCSGRPWRPSFRRCCPAPWCSCAATSRQRSSARSVQAHLSPGLGAKDARDSPPVHRTARVSRPGAHAGQQCLIWLARWWRFRKVHRLFGWKFLGFIVGGAPLQPGLEEFWRTRLPGRCRATA